MRHLHEQRGGGEVASSARFKRGHGSSLHLQEWLTLPVAPAAVGARGL